MATSNMILISSCLSLRAPDKQNRLKLPEFTTNEVAGERLIHHFRRNGVKYFYPDAHMSCEELMHQVGCHTTQNIIYTQPHWNEAGTPSIALLRSLIKAKRYGKLVEYDF